MNLDELKHTVEENYNLNINGLEKIKNVYRIKTDKEDYCLKVIRYNFPHFFFILSAIKHLQHRGFDRTPDILSKIDGVQYIKIDNYYAYLTSWINARECNYDNPLDVSKAACKLAELHNKSECYKVTKEMEPRVYWYKWPENFITRKNEILQFKKIIDGKEVKSEFDCLYSSVMEDELNRADKAIQNIMISNYVDKVKDEIVKEGFCHHDYAHHNVLLEESGRVNIIDFDYCILDINLHDLASLLIRKMKDGKWDIDDCISILDSYGSIRKIEKRDIKIMATLIEFPQPYWQLGIQYYLEKQPWGEEFFIKKLKKLNEDRDARQEFVDEFKFINYGS